ncbi:MAG TPA: EAL domain-containing protein [Stellaceae bacterium]|nr:EAL domain-containing protein [Stellaceae bacterium]
MAASLCFWLCQDALLLIHPGFEALDTRYLLGSLAVLVLGTLPLHLAYFRNPENFGLDRQTRSLGMYVAIGGIAGVLTAASHMLALRGLVDMDRVSSGLASLTLGVGAMTGATAISALVALPGPLGLTSGILNALTGLAITHLMALGALGSSFSYATIGLIVIGTMLLLLLVGAAGGYAVRDLRATGSRGHPRRGGRFRMLAEALPIPIILVSADSPHIVFANQRFHQQFGLLSRNAADGIDALYVQPEQGHKLAELVRRSGVVENQEVEVWSSDGTVIWTLVSARAITFEGEPTILMGFYDISDRKATEEALLASEVRYALISRASNDGIWDWDIPSGTVYYSARWKEIVGIEPGQRLNALDDWLLRVHPDDIDHLRNAIGEHMAGRAPQLDTEYRIRHGNGHYAWMHCRAIAIRNTEGKTTRMAGSQSDVTLRKTYEMNLLNAAYEDRLTGVKNRAFFSQLVDIRNTGTAIWGTAIILVNVDQFRRVNDSLGTVAGDALLIAVARHLAERIGPQDAVARLDSDEFAIWLHNVSDHLAAHDMAEAMLTDLNHPYLLNEVEMPVTVSIGLAAPTLGDAASGADLLRNARLALDNAKNNGGGRVDLFDDALLRETNLRRQLSRDLVAAERLGQVFLEYQPLVELGADGSNRLTGFEGLMRWRHRELGLIPPGRFIPLAEESGLINPLGLFAIEQATDLLTNWDAQGLAGDDLSISVNLSPRQVATRNGVGRLLSLIDKLRMPPGRLKLEITESVLMNDPDAGVETLEALRQRGIMMMLDDFGTGYSSLSYLHRFPLYALKIDRSFINRMSVAAEALRLVRSIIELGHDLGLRVVAEGVETYEQAERLRDLGCDFAQGYYFSHPLSAEAAGNMLARRETGGFDGDAHYAADGPVGAGGE